MNTLIRKMVIFDLDGTIALNEHRQHFVQVEPGQKKDWDSFFNACGDDEPNYPVIETLYSLHVSGFTPVIWSGRTDRVMDITKAWLATYGLAHISLRMRPDADKQSDVDLKEGWLKELDVPPRFVFDDRQKVVDMWRRNGIVCFQVAPGNF